MPNRAHLDFSDGLRFQTGSHLPSRSPLVRLHSNSFGGEAALHVAPDLASLLKVDSCACLDYSEIQRHDGPAETLRRLIGEHERVDARRVILGTSGLDWMPWLAGMLGVRTVIRAEGDFHGYDRYAQMRDVDRVTIGVDPRTHALDPAVVADAVRGRRSAMLCLTFSMTNPLQTPVTRAHVAAAVEANPDVVVLVDGAYRQFGDHRQLAALADEFQQVIYLQVASKDLFLPGARISWLIPSARHAARIAQTQSPYGLNTAAISQAIAILKRPDILAALRREQAHARDILYAGLSYLGLPIIGGPGPWTLIRWPTDAAVLIADLEHRFGILVQQQALPPLDRCWVRISATAAFEADRVVEAVTTLAREQGK